MATELFREPLVRKYYASRFSAAYCYYLLAVAVVVLVPFFVAFSSHNFWLKTNEYREQPEVDYQYRYISFFSGYRAGSTPFSYFSSPVASANDLFSSTLRMAITQSIEHDDNLDGLTDRVELNVQLPLELEEQVHAFTTVLFVDFKVQNRARVATDGMAVVSMSNSLPGQSAYVDGDLRLRQRWPLAVKGGFRDPYEDSPLVDWDSATLSASDLNVESLVQTYVGRNISLQFEEALSVWTPELGIPMQQDDRIFNATMVFRVPIQDVLYTPDVSEVLKHAWVQYAAFLVLVGFIMQRLSAFVFYNKLIHTETLADGAVKHHNY